MVFATHTEGQHGSMQAARVQMCVGATDRCACWLSVVDLFLQA
jgi:hypothetical protein